MAMTKVSWGIEAKRGFSQSEKILDDGLVMRQEGLSKGSPTVESRRRSDCENGDFGALMKRTRLASTFWHSNVAVPLLGGYRLVPVAVTFAHWLEQSMSTTTLPSAPEDEPVTLTTTIEVRGQAG